MGIFPVKLWDVENNGKREKEWRGARLKVVHICLIPLVLICIHFHFNFTFGWRLFFFVFVSISCLSALCCCKASMALMASFLRLFCLDQSMAHWLCSLELFLILPPLICYYCYCEGLQTHKAHLGREPWARPEIKRKSKKKCTEPFFIVRSSAQVMILASEITGKMLKITLVILSAS